MKKSTEIDIISLFGQEFFNAYRDRFELISEMERIASIQRLGKRSKRIEAFMKKHPLHDSPQHERIETPQGERIYPNTLKEARKNGALSLRSKEKLPKLGDIRPKSPHVNHQKDTSSSGNAYSIRSDD